MVMGAQRVVNIMAKNRTPKTIKISQKGIFFFHFYGYGTAI
jgi:hypothetical protein